MSLRKIRAWLIPPCPNPWKSRLSSPIFSTSPKTDKLNLELVNAEETGRILKNGIHYLVLAILTASLFIGSALLCLAPVTPLLLGVPWPAFLGFCMGGILFLYLLFCIFLRKK
mgnify:CR=1 FL=1